MAPGDSSAGVVWVWGARGGFEGPAGGIYGVLAEELLAEGITSLRLDYRDPRALHESVLDTLAGVSFLKGIGCGRVALVGHSFGGAVVIAAAPFSPVVVAVAALSSQTYGATNAADVSPRPLLLVHGADDTHLAPQCSEMIHQWAKEPKELVILPGAGHSLRQCQAQVHDLLKRWLAEKLGKPHPPTPSP
ncbi:MAG: alpha/beta fold hydrolase [Chloroflexi bacterium]|nr:alpha/beta fold hydrolase [Chloroflexota bacterium]